MKCKKKSSFIFFGIAIIITALHCYSIRLLYGFLQFPYIHEFEIQTYKLIDDTICCC